MVDFGTAQLKQTKQKQNNHFTEDDKRLVFN